MSIWTSLHLVGVIAWIGGTVGAALVYGWASKDAQQVVAQAARRVLLFVAAPGILLAWGGGLAMLLPRFSEVYARAGWMHGKLTLLLALAALSGVLSGKLRKAAAGTAQPSGGAIRAIALIMLSLAAGVVFLVSLRP